MRRTVTTMRMAAIALVGLAMQSCGESTVVDRDVAIVGSATVRGSDSLLDDGAESILTVERPPTSSVAVAGAHEQLYVGDVLVVESAVHGPMITFGFEGPVPSGGDVPITNWNWDDVADETSLMGSTWGGPWRVVGTWDGFAFDVRRPPLPVPDANTTPVVHPTEGCDEFSFVPARDEIAMLDRSRVEPFNDNVNTWDGHCGIVIEAFVDSVGLRDLLAPFDAQISEYRFLLHPMAQPPG